MKMFPRNALLALTLAATTSASAGAFRYAEDRSRRVFEFDVSGQLARVRQRSADDRLLWEAAYSDYRTRRQGAFAHQIDVDFPARAARTSIRFQTAELNRDLPASTFVLEKPSR